jgi:hypothetical protein
MNRRSAVGEILVVIVIAVVVLGGYYLVLEDSFTGADVADLARGGCPDGEHRQHVQGFAGGQMVDLSTCVADRQ